MSQHQSSQDVVGPPRLPFAVYRLSASRANKYLLYDIDTVTWLRSAHHILGVTVGGLPQFPQQNVFFGLPLELMPEEVRLLVEKGLAFVVDDLEAHKDLMSRLRLGRDDARAAVRSQKTQIDGFVKQAQDMAAIAKREGEEIGREKRAKRMGREKKPKENIPEWNAARLPLDQTKTEAPSAETSLFEPGATSQTEAQQSKQQEGEEEAPLWAVTPATSSTLMPASSLPESREQVAASDARYSVFKHLHDRGYYMTPGLRFGCHFTAYPGDPLRYHSHFLANGFGWDEELDLLDIVGGGRLGTGVKKGFLVGGVQADGDRRGETRTFCIEWGGM